MTRKRKARGHYLPADDPELERMSNPQLVSLRDDIGSQLGAITTTARYLQHKCEHITAIIRSRADPPLKVSDHAVIRYLEKVVGQDLDAVRREITDLAAKAKEGRGVICRGKGDAISVTSDGLTFVLTHDYVVATLYRATEDFTNGLDANSSQAPSAAPGEGAA